MIDRLKARRSQPLLGLSLDGSSFEAVLVRPSNGHAEASTPLVIPLPTDILHGDPAAQGRSLRDALDHAGLRSRRCAVALPASWTFVASFPLPDLPPDDLEGFIDLEVERSFPYGPDQLAIARHPWNDASGLPCLTLVAVPLEHLERLEATLRAARLHPVSLAPALPELLDLAPSDPSPRLDLLASQSSISLSIASADGLVIHRALDEVLVKANGAPAVAPDRLQRELRVTLGQLPPNIRQGLARARVLGHGPVAASLHDALVSIAPRLALSVAQVDRVPENRPASPRITQGLPTSPALAIAARHLGNRPASFEFLAPSISPIQALVSRFSSGRTAHYGIAAAAALLVVAAAFLVQQVRLFTLRSKWNAMAKTVAHVESLQANIKKFRPWFDDSVPSLLVLRTLTTAFPDDDTLTAKTVELREGALIVCSGTAKDSAALNRTLEKLRAAPEVRDVTVDQMRGKSPVQFSFNFHWDASGGTP